MKKRSYWNCGTTGFPPFRLGQHPAYPDNGEIWLVEETSSQILNVAAGPLRRLGIWSGKVYGNKYHSPITMPALGQYVLVREPQNEYDKNAIAFIDNSGNKVGYVNRGMAVGLAKEIDSGNPITAISLGNIRWIAGAPAMINFLMDSVRQQTEPEFVAVRPPSPQASLPSEHRAAIKPEKRGWFSRLFAANK